MLPNEPRFTLLGRDPLAGYLVSIWSSAHMGDGEAVHAKFTAMINRFVPGIGGPDYEHAQRAIDTALAMFAWREGHAGRAREEIDFESTNGDGIEQALRAAIMALRSYEFGNGAPDLARSTADAGDDALRAAGLAPATLGAVR